MKNITKIGFLFLLLLWGNTQLAQAQFIEEEIPDKEDNNTSFWPEKIFFGGNLGLSFGSNSAYVNISPFMGYRVLPLASVGVGPLFEYYSNSYSDYKNNSLILGGKVFMQSIFFDFLMLYGEINLIRYTRRSYYHSNMEYTHKANRAVPWLGGGYYQKSGRNSGLYILFLFNMNYDPDFIYPSYDIRVGFNF